MIIYCYRDLLLPNEPGQAGYFGVNLYFITGSQERGKPGDIPGIFGIIERIADHLKEDRRYDTGRAIERILQRHDPLVDFLLKCIEAGTPKTRCYFDARAAGVSARKQVVLAMYEYLKLEIAMQEPTQPPPDGIAPGSAFLETIQDFFEDELAQDSYFGSLEYVRSDISQCRADDIQSADTGNLSDGDFLFEIGELRTATLRYFGYYHASTGRMPCRVYPEFDTAMLVRLLKRRR